MALFKLAAVFAVIVVMMNLKPTIRGQKRKLSLFWAILAGCLFTALLYRIAPLRVAQLLYASVCTWSTLSLCLVTYLITFLQRMMEQKQHLMQAQDALSGIFNSRRVNITLAPVVVGMLPSPGAAFIAGDMVKAACGDALDVEEQAFVTSYFRHISESFLPTYTSIILGLSLSGVATGSFLLGMVLPVLMLIVLGYLFYVRKVPKATGRPPATDVRKEWLRLGEALWAIALVIVLIIALDLPIWLAVLIAVVLYFLVYRFRFTQVRPYFRSAFEWTIMGNILSVMFFKNLIEESGVNTLLPEVLTRLPLPTPMIFALIFLLGSVIAGSNAIVAMCVPMAFAAMPEGGMPLLVLLLCCTYIAMQISPVHICLTLIAEYFHVNFGTLVKKTLPVMGCFVAFLVVYYYLLVWIL